MRTMSNKRLDVRSRFGRRVRELRVRKRLTQVEFAERLGLDRSYLADVERGNRNISLMNIELISRGLKISLSELFRQL
jgi:transcriptional regulator with XRE-family HTH domain